jgi:hypothetical protein
VQGLPDDVRYAFNSQARDERLLTPSSLETSPQFNRLYFQEVISDYSKLPTDRQHTRLSPRKTLSPTSNSHTQDTPSYKRSSPTARYHPQFTREYHPGKPMYCIQPYHQIRCYPLITASHDLSYTRGYVSLANALLAARPYQHTQYHPIVPI